MIKQGDFIVSCQALEDEPLHSSFIMGRMARAAIQGGANGIRANSVEDILEIKKEVDVPVIGIIKKDYEGYEVFITPTIEEIRLLIDAGVDVIAIDATNRIRPNNLNLEQFLKQIKDEFPSQKLMADCSTLEEVVIADKLGFDYIGSTLVGYTEESRNLDISNNDFELLKEMILACKNSKFIAEGNVDTPQKAKQSFNFGAFAVVVGSIITRPKVITERFIKELND